MFKSMAIAAFSLSSILVAPLASANWQVNNEQSNVSFVSIKKNSVAEARLHSTAQRTEKALF